MGPLMLPDAHVEQLRRHLAHLRRSPAPVRLATRSLVFIVAPTAFAALARSFIALALSARSLVFWLSSAGQLLLAIVVEHVALPVRKRRRVRGRNARDLEDRIAFAGGRRLRRIALLRLNALARICEPSGSAAITPAARPAAWSPLPDDAQRPSSPGRS